MIQLNIKEAKNYDLVHNGLEVRIKPLSKREDIELEKRFTTGRMAMEKGHRRKETDKLFFPETDFYNLNLARAKKTWIQWNLADEKGKALECNEKNIEFLFNNHWDEYVRHILDQLDEFMQKHQKKDSDKQEKIEKN